MTRRLPEATAMSALPDEIELPANLQARLAGYDWQQNMLGRSSASVFRLEAADRPTLFLKHEPAGPFTELPDEALRLRWLAAQGIPCAAVVAEAQDAERNWLLLTAVEGEDLASADGISAADRVTFLADALRRLHSLDIATCPFDHRLENRLPHVRARMQAGVVDESDFDDERIGRSSEELYRELETLKPANEDLVVTHGDACLPNIMADPRGFTGFIDCARLGLADRHQDIALSCRSIRYNLGQEWVQPFLDLYGLPSPDPAKLSYYRLLDEFF